MKRNSYYVTLVNPYTDESKSCVFSGFTKSEAAVEAVKTFGLEGWYVVESVVKLR